MAILTERTAMAKAINCEGRKVLMYNEDAQFANDRGSKACFYTHSDRYGAMRHDCTLYRDYHERGDGIFWLMQCAGVLSKEVYIQDYVEDAEFASSPVIKEGDKVAVLVYSYKNKKLEVHTLVAGRVGDFSDACVFKEERKEE